ncbi:MAG: tetratricopeptide repeat protein, partial [Chloroflexota bacterium]
RNEVPNLQLVGVFANPMSVALSLYQQRKTPLKDGYKKAAEYNSHLLKLHQSAPFPLFCTDLEGDHWLARFEQLLNILNKQFKGQLSFEYAAEKYEPQRLFFQNYGAVIPNENIRPSEYSLVTQADSDYKELLFRADTTLETPKVKIPLKPIAVALEHTVPKLELYTLLSDAQMENGNFVEAAKSYRSALNLAPGQIDLLHKLAEAQTKANLIQEAIESYDQIIQSQHVTVGILVKQILLHKQQSQHQRVMELGEKGLRMNPASWKHYLLTLMAQSATQLGERERALELYSNALAIDSHQGYIHPPMGDIYRETGNFPAAVEHYQQAIQQGDLHVWIYIHLAHSLNQLKQFVESRHALAQAVKIDSNIPSIYTIWGDSFRLADDDPSAIEYYKKALILAPEDFGILITLGWALIRCDQLLEASTIISKAATIQPQNVHVKRAQEHLGSF